MRTPQLQTETAILALTFFHTVADCDLDQGAMGVSHAQNIFITFNGDRQPEALIHVRCKTHREHQSCHVDEHSGCGKASNRHKSLGVPAPEKKSEETGLALTLGQFLKMQNAASNDPINVSVLSETMAWRSPTDKWCEPSASCRKSAFCPSA